MALYDRGYTLLVGEAGKVGLKVDTSLHIEFNIVKSDKAANKNKATFSVYNLSDDSIAKIKRNQKVEFRAGYVEDNPKIMFLGQVTDVSTKREGVTVKTTIKCEDGYVPVREGHTCKSFPAGSSVGFIISEIVTNDLGLPKPLMSNGNLGDSKGINKKYQKSVPKQGHSGNIITKLCKENFLTWSIRDGNVIVYPVNGSTGVAVPKLSSASGMIGSPQRATDNKSKLTDSKDIQDAYKVKSLLNGTFNTGDLIEIVSSFTTGQYRITKVTHKGSFRGTDWFSELEVAEGVK